MKLICVKDAAEMSAYAAKQIGDAVRRNPKLVLGLATGGTPKETYRLLVEEYNKKAISFRNVRTVNLDEYVGLSSADPNSYRMYMKQNLFDKIDISFDNCHLPDGIASSPSDACVRYDRMINELNGIDLQLLGIGRNGHIGFNEPGTPFDAGTHLVKLSESTRKANARYFHSEEEVPKQAITMGIGTILKSRAILLIVSGSSKADAMGRLLSLNGPDPAFPASALLMHPDVTVIADREALSKSKIKAGATE
ncbi:glucosamine-6-phosphate deaminase [Sporolactobacillus spathodeae]|uniref:Glucosamine-6-phosphate deaminase n=1 Tax=Sporolactobacillus spathodeae TaxID=1465502 RepID=A0ABS2QB62_9BACL|nr:glucosamine-6-phosphate deaminase [Sporolactobacillus spathodeae]MBM7658861.1 glucosamine-6-phosphate deaminase [Sporolactobacillus spathodeae]